MNDSFILYTSYYALIEGLTDEQLGQLTRAIFLYARDGKTISLEPVVRMAFAFIKDNIERNQDKYQAKCEKNRQIALERERKKREAREKAGDTNVHERSRTCENNTNVHERSPYDNDNDNDNDNEYDNDVSKETNILEPSKEASMQSFSEKNVCAAEEPQKSSEKKKSKKGEIDYAAVKEYWNRKHDETKSAMPPITLMTENRKVMVKARVRQCKGDVKTLFRVIDIAMASDFMNGNNKHGWLGKFDWIFGNEQNFAKVLEGNFNNEPATSQQPQSAAARAQDPAATARPSIGELYEQAKHQQPASQQSQDSKFRWVIQQNLEDLKKNPNNKPAKDSLTRYYERGVLQRLGIDWKPEK